VQSSLKSKDALLSLVTAVIISHAQHKEPIFLALSALLNLTAAKVRHASVNAGAAGAARSCYWSHQL